MIARHFKMHSGEESNKCNQWDYVFAFSQWSHALNSISATSWGRTGRCHFSCNDPRTLPTPSIHVIPLLLFCTRINMFPKKPDLIWICCWECKKRSFVCTVLTWNKCEGRKSDAVQIKLILIQKVQTKVLTRGWRNARRRETGYLI